MNDLNGSWYCSRPFVITLFALFALLHLFIVCLNHFYFRTVAFDYAAYNFAFYDFAHLRISPCPVYLSPYPVSFFQDHFSLLLPLLSPLYWLLSPVTGTYTLLILQWALIVWGGIATYRMIRSRSRHSLLPILATILYFTVFGRFSAYRADANLATMGAALLPVFLYFFQQRRFGSSVSVFILLLVTREDFALLLFFMGLFLAVLNRRDKTLRQRALILTIAAAAYFVICFGILIPQLLEDDNKKYSLFNYKVLGEGPADALKFIILHPLEFIRLLYTNHLPEPYFADVKKDFYVVYLLSGGCILLLRPAYLLPFVPLIAKKMLNDQPLRWSVETYYSVEIATLLPVMTFMVIASFKNRTLQLVMGAVVCAAAITVTLVRILVTPARPLVSEDNKYNFVSPAFYSAEFPHSQAREALKLIPANAAVAASNRIAAHLAFREKIYLFPRVSDARYVLLFTDNDTYPLSPELFESELEKLRKDPRWRVLRKAPGLLLLQKTSGSGL